MAELTKFTSQVIAVVRKIPRGRVATYRQVAALAGKIHASRGVAWILNSSSEKYALPWQRVISSKGKISFAPGTTNYRMQKRLLLREGVKVSASGEIKLAVYQYKKMPASLTATRRLPRLGGH